MASHWLPGSPPRRGDTVFVHHADDRPIEWAFTVIEVFGDVAWLQRGEHTTLITQLDQLEIVERGR